MTVIQTDTKTALTDNAYFIHHPERIVHTMAKLDTDPYGKPAMVYLHEGKAAGIAGDLRRMLDEDFHYRLAMRLYSGSIRQAGTEEKVAVQNKVERPAINWKQYPRRRRWKLRQKSRNPQMKSRR